MKIVTSAGFAVAALFAMSLAGGTAHAQVPMPGSPLVGGQGLHRPSEPQVIAPPALPGAAGVGNISAGSVATSNEDPTKVLFSAINHGDYTGARAAVSRGANLNARNALGETPIELSVELNRNNITFMLLSVRNEEGAGGAPDDVPAPAGVTTMAQAKAPSAVRAARSNVRFTATHAATVAPAPMNDPGVPNPAAGFLGFGGH